MLTSLRIENFAIVSQLELDFSLGMTAFTGETGAGKSIMIDALMLALGERADTSVIRKGAEKCDISASFHIDAASQPAEWLAQHDIANPDNEIILRRMMYTEGRSKSYINGQPFPLQKIKEIGELLVDIHGQHQHQTLLHHATHRQQLDQYANHGPLLDHVQQLYAQCQKIHHELQQLKSQVSASSEGELLQHHLDELDHLALQDGEMHQLHEEHQRLHHARDYLENTQQILAWLSADDQPNICKNLNHVLQALIYFPEEYVPIKNAIELINSALIQCEEARDEIGRFSTQIQLDPQRLQMVEERIGLLHQAARKFHVEASQLPAHALYLRQQLERLNDAGALLSELEQQYDQTLQAYQNAAVALRQSRQEFAKKLADEITQSIQLLGMPKGYVTIDITPLDKISVHGLDKVEYRICTNPGMLPDTVAKIASGGELSRIGLAIHVITAQRGSTPTLLFDEVDVGIGGATAALVGQLLRTLGERLQVFCVTHQPQVASAAHHHFLVEKECHNEQTFSRVLSLQSTDKVDEIARMLGGLTITEQTRSHARELLIQSSLH
jgi:DNA repair protein RecN (Recombination protein N)